MTEEAGLELSRETIIADYRLAFRSRVASVLGRREVLTGKAPFGIFGDGKEVAQLAMAKAFRPGDWRSGYYRDQTFMFATGMSDLPRFFAQLYAHADVAADPASAGRQMVAHFATRSLDTEGRWVRLVDQMNSAPDLSPVAGQMPHSVGLAYASKLFRQEPGMRAVADGLSRNGDEVCFATIGNAGTSEGPFWESLNAAGVLQVPLAISVWDDGFGISVPNQFQTTKSSISAVLEGFRRSPGSPGYDIRVVKGWDYPALCDAYAMGIERVRRDHTPALFHITEMTQPQGHSTSGSHERYKSRERLRFEVELDPIARMREWMIREELATAEELDKHERADRRDVDEIREAAWNAFQEPIRREHEEALALVEKAAAEAGDTEDVRAALGPLREATEMSRRLVQSSVTLALAALRAHAGPAKDALADLRKSYAEANDQRYNSWLYSTSGDSPLRVAERQPVYSERSETVDGRIVLLRCFEENFKRDPRLFVMGEDIGKLGDVNLVFEGLQSKFGELRVTDTGIREATILGQGIGCALRGLRPIVDIQYVDYLLYALQLACDDLATTLWRTAGGQKAPVVIRTKGHRLQGIWHTGSPMAVILNALRGVRVAVPRNMTQAAGMYNTLFRGDDPAILIEVLSGYRLKEKVPDNVGDFTVRLGIPEVLRVGSDVTLVTYGALCRIALEAAQLLARAGIEVEIIDVQTLEPFDIEHRIVASVRKTSAIVVVDEDVPGGASAFLMQQILEKQSAFEYLDATPRTLTARANRAAVGQDGDYFSKPNREDIVAAVYGLMRERRPAEFPPLV